MLPVIRSIAIKNFRGFRDFRLKGLTGLTILTGRNGCGKSTVLDALLIGSSPRCSEAVGLTVKRHPLSKDGARWLFNKVSEPIEIRIETDAERQPLPRRLRFSEPHGLEARELVELLEQRERSKPFRQVSSMKFGPGPGEVEAPLGSTVFDLYGEFQFSGMPEPGAEVKLVDPANFVELADAYSRLLEDQGNLGKQRLLQLLERLVPDIASIEILTRSDGPPSLALAWPKKTVPLSFVGDGIAAMTQIAIEASNVGQGGSILIEEPEVFLHPRAISLAAGFLLTLMREGRQVVITTHSLEFVDSLLGQSDDADLDRMSLINLRPGDGDPTYVAWPGKELDYVREKIGEDLR